MNELTVVDKASGSVTLALISQGLLSLERKRAGAFPKTFKHPTLTGMAFQLDEARCLSGPEPASNSGFYANAPSQ
jgi:hypothetical protein